MLKDIKYYFLRLLFAEVQKIKRNTIPEKKRETDYLLGASPIKKEILRPDGQWTDCVPVGEVQSKGTETMACTCFSLLNILETLAKVKYGESWNKSDRYSAKMTGCTRSGNAQSIVLDITRKTAGLIDEELWPFDDNFTWSDFYADIPLNLRQLGANWTKEWIIGYEVVPLNNKTAMKEALKYSPLYVAGYAWAQSNGLYRSWGRANHSFVLVGYVEGQYWLVYDSYSPFLKKLDWNYLFGAMRVITLDKANANPVAELEAKGVRFVMRPESHGEFYMIDGGSLVYLPDKDSIKRALNAETDMSLDILELVKNGKLKMLSENSFNKLKIPK